MRDCSVPREMRSPSRPTNNGFRAGHWERPDATAMCFCLTAPGKRMARLRRYAVDDTEQFGLDGDAAVLAAFAFDMNDCGAVVGGADVTHIGLAQFLGPYTGQQPSKDQCEIALSPVCLVVRILVVRDCFQKRFDGGAGEGLREGFGEFRPADELHGVGC